MSHDDGLFAFGLAMRANRKPWYVRLWWWFVNLFDRWSSGDWFRPKHEDLP